jgi:hypothetical protein
MPMNVGLQKSKTVLSRSGLSKTLKLHEKQPWLTKKSIEIEELRKICRTNTDLELVFDLLLRFKYLCGDEKQKCLKKIVNKIVSGWKLSPRDTVIVSKGFENYPDSSATVSYLVQPTFGKFQSWTRKNFTLYTRDALRNSTFKNIVLVDDFSGSGTSVLRFLRWVDKVLSDENLPPKKIYVCFFSAMKKTRKAIGPLLGDRVYAAHWLKRGISDYDAKKAGRRRDAMRELEKSLSGLNPKFSLGFEASEALYACENFNIPNNNFPIFWYDRGQYNRRRTPLFGRLRKG